MNWGEDDPTWSQKMAGLAVSSLVYANILREADYDRAVGIVAEEINVRLALQDRLGYGPDIFPPDSN